MTNELTGIVPDEGWNPFAQINGWTERLMTQTYVVKDCQDKMRKAHGGRLECDEEDELFRMLGALREIGELTPRFIEVVASERMRQGVNSCIRFEEVDEGSPEVYYDGQRSRWHRPHARSRERRGPLPLLR